MKCATSWIHHYLDTLPEVAVSPLKELHFFDTRFPANALGDMDALAIRRLGFHAGRDGNPVENLHLNPTFRASVDRVQMIYDDNAYFAHFARLCTDDTRVLCDITPAYAVIGPTGFDYLRAFFATQGARLKLLFVMRDPVDRLWSQLRHLQQVNPDGRIADRWDEAIRSPQICARADYRGTVQDLDDTFAAPDILYLFYEDLFTEPALRRLCGFVGAAYRPGDTAVRQNATRLERPLPEAARRAFHDLLAPQYAFCHHRFGRDVPGAWRA